MSINITVCLCTYKRHHLFDTLLSLEQQVLPHDITFDVSIADNDPDGSGLPIVNKIRKSTSLDIIYNIQPEKNIAVTRNMSVKHAKGDWLAFIDDDEIADKNWLNNLVVCAQRYNAAAVVGQVNTLYPEHCPDWIKDGNLLGRETPATGTLLDVGLTGNSLVKRSAILNLQEPFAPKYGLTGGEDSAFFLSLYQRGQRIVACREALVTETAAPQRLNKEYLYNRAIQNGESYATIHLSQCSTMMRQLHKARACLQAGFFLIMSLIALPVGFKHRIGFQLRMLINWGKFRSLNDSKSLEIYR